MFPKVATQLIHHTTRAVAAVQGSGHAFRNVIQSSSSGTTTTVNWPGVGTSGSSWGNAGTGAGGAKYQSSSKFYHGYQGAGRSLTQASQASAVDSDPNQSDDAEDPFFRPVPSKSPSGPLTGVRRSRSHSLVLGSKGQVENTKTGDRPGVLEVVRIHARASHAFAPHNRAADETVANPTPLGSRPKLSRRASTSSVTSSPPLDDVPPSPQPVPFLNPSLPSIAPSTQDPAAQIRAKLAQLSSQKDSGTCTYLNQLLENGQIPQDTSMYEAAIQAVIDTHENRSDFSLLIKLFDEMSQRNLSPSAGVYRTLILAHLDRDFEVVTAIGLHEQNFAARQARNKLHHDQGVHMISKLKSERNLHNAIRVFQAANKAQIRISPDVYANLLRGCVRHSDAYAALRVFGHLEKEHGSCIPLVAYFDMMRLYSKTNDLAAAEETFAEFKKAVRLENVSYESIAAPGISSVSRVEPWNLMIDIYLRAGRQAEALTILETMLDSHDSSTPPPSLSTFHTLIAGFCAGNDIETALRWFRRFLQETTVAEDASAPLPAPPRPDAKLWNIIVGALAQRNMIDEINTLYSEWLSTKARDSIAVAGDAHKLVTWANVAHLEAIQQAQNMASSELQKKVDHVVDKIVGNPRDWILTMDRTASDTMHKIVKLYARDGRFDEGIKFLQTYVLAHQEVVGTPQAGDELSSVQSGLLSALRHRVWDLTEWLLRRQVPPPFAVAKVFATITNGLDMALSFEAAETYISTYEASRKSGQINTLTLSDAETLIAAGVRVVYTNNGPVDGQPESHPLVRFETLLADIAGCLQDLSTLSPTAIDGVVRGLRTWYPVESLHAVLEKLGEPWSALWNQPTVQEQISLTFPTHASEPANSAPVKEISRPSTPSSGTAVVKYRTSFPLSQKIDEHLIHFKTASPNKAYDKFLVGYSDGFYPTAATFGRLINALGRAREIEKVNFVYEAAQHAISIANTTPGEHPNGPWYQVENHMIIALAHAGDVEGAHNHRLKILERSCTPSADAYGALISCVKDTTDDSANAYSLYRESQIRGVVPNVYLYNTMISKLAKARKADVAMELFSKMKENGFWPSSVSYGAVIGACSRVGDIESAEALFEEMSSQPNFKPRVPPFNTMMQLYTYTRRNREKVLHYYDSMVAAGVRPTAHTYKACPALLHATQNANLPLQLLMDAYGTIEPVDITAMEKTFATLCADPSVRVLGTHWGSLINTYGCIQKDLDHAVEVFESIESHPSTLKGVPMPDAVSYEALINVFVTLRRTDLIPVYMDRFRSSGVHMTAYISNLLIKGYAIAGELEKARYVFASLADPPTGVAAPNNHAPHELDAAAVVQPNAPVYREPSTWEAMVRAELGNGNREEAVALLEKMQARQFPAAVYSRISGIMLDGSVSPWPAPTPFASEQQ
ncbi:hypothetical protein BJ322DRAFT_1111026 [Thelephora terrestris]|uniref:PROP1-like PPR domain-containing protein n=1 Tax=Thelephora terrestris TaxID=56493 RepID=A0A9P6H9R0_9AGAM|nr:hypothetical protein BJ322DRAFT_1111026 [Thelephora terrestris]